MRLPRGSWVLIVFSILNQLTGMFVGAFLVAYIMRLVTNDITAVSTFKLMEYFALMIGSFAASYFCKRYNKVFVFGIHLVAYAILMMALVVLGDTVIDQLFMVGIMYGIAESLYHFPYNMIVAEKIAPSKMAKFNSIKGVWQNASKVIIPTLLGIFITFGTFVEVAQVMVIIICMEFGLLFMIRGVHKTDKEPLELRGFMHRVSRCPIIRNMLFAECLRGMTNLIDTIVTMYTIYIFHTDLNLGICTTIFAICTVFISWLYSRYTQRRHFRFVMHMCVLAMVAGICVFVAAPSQITFLIYCFMVATAMNILCYICETIMFNVVQSPVVAAKYKSEYMASREMALGLGRWLVLLMLLYIGVFGGIEILRWSLLVMGGALVLATRISFNISSKLAKMS